MPRIPTISADERGYRIPSSPDVITNPAADAGEGIGRAGVKLANTFADIQSRLNQQAADTEYLQAKTQFNTQKDALKLSLPSDPEVVADPSKYETLYATRLRDSIDEIRKNFKTSAGSNYFAAYVTENYPRAIITARGDGLKLQGKQAIAQLDVQKAELSKKAAEAATPEEQQLYIDDYQKYVYKARARTFLDDVQAVERVRSFRESVQEQQIGNLANGDQTSRNKLRELARTNSFQYVPIKTVETGLSVADAKERREETRSKQVIQDARDYMMNGLVAGAIANSLDDSVLGPIKRNENPIITPEDGLKLQHIMDTQGGNGLAAQALVSEYARQPGAPTRARVEEYKRRLNELILNDGNSEKATAAARYFNSELNAVRTIESSELSSSLKFAEETYKAGIKPVPNSIRGLTGAHNREVADIAEINRLIRERGVRKPEDAAKIVEEVRKRKQEKLDNRNDSQKLLDEALPRR